MIDLLNPPLAPDSELQFHMDYFDMIQLRDYQQTFINEIRAAFSSGHRSVMAVASTGSGKTVCFSYVADNAAKLGNTTFILVHRKELIRQTSDLLSQHGISHGIIAAGYPITDTAIQVCSVQTLARRLDVFHPPDLLVIDEAHHCQASQYACVLEWAAKSAVLGVTATPVRTDGRGFDKIFSTLICAIPINELIDQCWLSRPILYAPPIPEIDLSNVHMLADDYNKQELGLAMDKQVITGSAVEHYKRLLPNMPPSVAFCVSIQHAQHVAQEFCNNDVAAASIDGTMADDERIDLISKLENGTIRVLTSCDLISEGFDLPAIACAIMLRPTKSLAVYLQQAGRSLRPAPGKTETLILDHVENWKHHGLIDEPREWSLEGRKKRSKSTKDTALITCPKCYAVFPPAPKCPNCRHDLKIVSDGSGRKIEERDGNLVQIDRDKVLSFRATTARRFKHKQVIEKLQRVDAERADTTKCYCSAVQYPPCGYCEGGWMTAQLQEA